MAISDTSGISIPSLNRFIPTTTSYLPSLNSLIILSLSNVFILLLEYIALICLSFWLIFGC